MNKQDRKPIQWVRSAISTALVLILLNVLISSCYYRENEVIRPEPPPDEISYSENIQPIWDQSCATAGCHNGLIPPNLNPNVSYDNLIGGGYVDENNPASSDIYTSVTTGSMAQYAQPGDAELILQWIEEGAENN